jgi:hypothetical protein
MHDRSIRSLVARVADGKLIFIFRYICVVLGLPSCINERDVTQELPVVFSPIEMDASDDTPDQEASALSGFIAHVK